MTAIGNLLELGVRAELIDLRTLWPWDRGAVFSSIEKTGRALIVHESVRAGGFGAEIAAEAGEALWGKLRAPIRRLGQERVPMPYSKPLESHFRITSDLIIATVTNMVQHRGEAAPRAGVIQGA